MIAVISRPDQAGQLRGTGLLIRSETLRAVCPRLTLQTDPLIGSYALAVARLLSRQSYSSIGESHVRNTYVAIKLKVMSEETELASAVRAASKASRILIVTGPAGAGKSSTVRHIAAKCWSAPAEVGLEERHLPLYIRANSLDRWSGKSVNEKIYNTIVDDSFLIIEETLTYERFAGWLEDSDLAKLLVIDGFDEAVYEYRTILVDYIDLISTNEAYKILLSLRPVAMLETVGRGGIRAEVSAFFRRRSRKWRRYNLGKTLANF